MTLYLDVPVANRKKEELSPKLVQFCHEYIKDSDGKRAAMSVGIPEKSAAVWASRKLNDERVKKKIREVLVPQMDRLKIEAQDVLEFLASVLHFDLADAYGEDGALLPVRDMPPHIRKCLVGIDVYKDFTEGVEIGETKKIKLADKLKAAELLGKYFKLFIDKVEHSVDENLAEQMARARARVKAGEK